MYTIHLWWRVDPIFRKLDNYCQKSFYIKPSLLVNKTNNMVNLLPVCTNNNIFLRSKYQTLSEYSVDGYDYILVHRFIHIRLDSRPCGRNTKTRGVKYWTLWLFELISAILITAELQSCAYNCSSAPKIWTISVHWLSV